MPCLLPTFLAATAEGAAGTGASLAALAGEPSAALRGSLLPPPHASSTASAADGVAVAAAAGAAGTTGGEGSTGGVTNAACPTPDPAVEFPLDEGPCRCCCGSEAGGEEAMATSSSAASSTTLAVTAPPAAIAAPPTTALAAGAAVASVELAAGRSPAGAGGGGTGGGGKGTSCVEPPPEPATPPNWSSCNWPGRCAKRAGSTWPSLAFCMAAIFSFNRSCLFWNSFSGLYGFGTNALVFVGSGSKKARGSRCGAAGGGGTRRWNSALASFSPMIAIRNLGLSFGSHSSWSVDHVSKLILTAPPFSSATRAAHHPFDHSTRRRVPTCNSCGFGRGVPGSDPIGNKCLSCSYCVDAVDSGSGAPDGGGGSGLPGALDGGGGSGKPGPVWLAGGIVGGAGIGGAIGGGGGASKTRDGVMAPKPVDAAAVAAVAIAAAAAGGGIAGGAGMEAWSMAKLLPPMLSGSAATAGGAGGGGMPYGASCTAAAVAATPTFGPVTGAEGGWPGVPPAAEAAPNGATPTCGTSAAHDWAEVALCGGATGGGGNVAVAG
mmetsp:Transcript_7563/g.19229  ORF Transcript_7563/g.19229 Transcript_7563/m.19229 type:complete len:548 (+) Transcript_7563:268-1911(+)